MFGRILLNTVVALHAIALAVTVALLQFLDCGMSTEIAVGWPRYICNIRPVELGSFEGVQRALCRLHSADVLS